MALLPEVLVNNAGFGDAADFALAEPERLLQMLQLNVVALTEITRLFLPGMLARRRGRIMLLGSTAAFQPGPGMAVYFATKAFVLSLGEALAEELRGTGVTVTTLCPGATATEFAAAANAQNRRLFKRRLAHVMSSADVAEEGCPGAPRRQAGRGDGRPEQADDGHEPPRAPASPAAHHEGGARLGIAGLRLFRAPAAHRQALRDVPGDERPLDQHHDPEEGEAEGRQHEDDGEGEVHAEVAAGDLDVVAEAGVAADPFGDGGARRWRSRPRP